MKNATRITVSTFGVLAGLAGVEHGLGEILQGNKVPGGVVIESWPGSPFFEILAGEPAMTLVPNLLATGILAVLFSLVFLVWAVCFVQRKRGGWVLILLTIPMLLLGAGFGPPLLGLLLGAAATRIHSPLAWPRPPRSSAFLRFLAESWPWSYSAGLIAWLLLFPGSTILAYFFGLDDPNLVVVFFFLAMGTLLLAIFGGFARDAYSDSWNASTLAPTPARRPLGGLHPE